MSKEYVPIPCDIYNRYEVAIIQGRRLRIGWSAARGMARIEMLEPVDLRTRRGAEYMVARAANGGIRIIRLDRIRRADALR